MTQRKRLPNHVIGIVEQIEHEAQKVIELLKPFVDGQQMSSEHSLIRSLRATNAAQNIQAQVKQIEIEPPVRVPESHEDEHSFS